jgi:hypothetical protein
MTGRSRLNNTFGQLHRALKGVEEDLKKVIHGILKMTVESQEIMRYLEFQYPEELDQLCNPPEWISVAKAVSADDDSDGVWRRVGERGRTEAMDDSMYAYWKNGRDLEFLQLCSVPPEKPEPKSTTVDGFRLLTIEAGDGVDDIYRAEEDEEEGEEEEEDAVEEQWMKESEAQAILDPLLVEEDSDASTEEPDVSFAMKPASPTQEPASISPSDWRDPAGFFGSLGLRSIPTIPESDRLLENLLDVGAIWTLSLKERTRLDEYWRDQAQSTQMGKFENLRQKHATILDRCNESRNEVSNL